ncbi:putative Nitrogen assimilation transcription factor nirA [Seiridium unicorne]|uniref:Nitrogen assimilation transcription factor nirA n=1 Tax=Seiridium unicorne TaxID=138068 RepID=A0ABR2V3Q3_9PEZI
MSDSPTYFTSYCAYRAASIQVLQVRDPDADVSAAAVQRLATTLRMLEAEAAQTPEIRRSVDTTKAQLKKAGYSNNVIEIMAENNDNLPVDQGRQLRGPEIGPSYAGELGVQAYGYIPSQRRSMGT